MVLLAGGGSALEGALSDARRTLVNSMLNEPDRAEANKIIAEIDRSLLRISQLRELSTRRQSSVQ